jgi:diadenosine tetraphosphate (Ap4A) HIT family hydrolase
MEQGRLKVDHVHFHLLPRTFKDELYQKCQINETNVFEPLLQEEIVELRQKLLPK